MRGYDEKTSFQGAVKCENLWNSELKPQTFGPAEIFDGGKEAPEELNETLIQKAMETSKTGCSHRFFIFTSIGRIP